MALNSGQFPTLSQYGVFDPQGNLISIDTSKMPVNTGYDNYARDRVMDQIYTELGNQVGDKELAKLLVQNILPDTQGRTDYLRDNLTLINQRLQELGKPQLGSFEQINKQYGGFQNAASSLLSGSSVQNPNNQDASGGSGDLRRSPGAAPLGGPTGTTTGGGGANTGGGSPSGTTATTGGYTRDAKGNVFDSTGKHLDMKDIPKGADGKPSINLETLPVGQYTLDASGTSINSTTGVPSWADQKAIDGLKFQFGWTDQQAQDFIKSSPTEARQWALTGEYLKNQADLSQLKTATNAQELAKAHQAALAELNDPTSTLGQKYQDLDKTNLNNFNANLEAIRTNTNVQQAQQQIDFNNQKTAQANAAAAAGTAYSGFRNKAAQELGTQQSGIVQSSLSTLKQNLQGQLQPLEQYYGSSQFASMFGNTGVNFLNPTTGQNQNVAYNQVGNLTGTQTGQKQADVAQETQNLYSATATQ